MLAAISRHNSYAAFQSPWQISAPFSAPMELPETAPKVNPFSRKAFQHPSWYAPFAPPAESASPSLRFLICFFEPECVTGCLLVILIRMGRSAQNLENRLS